MYWLCCMVVHSPSSLWCGGVSHREGEREGKCCGRVEVGEMSDQCGTACALHQHPAAHGMPAHCEVGDGHPTACPPACCAWLLCMAAVHGCCAWLLCMAALPLLHMMMVVVEEEEEEERERGQPCASRKISTQVCVPTCTGCRAGDSAACGTRIGGHPSFHTAA